MHDSGSETDAFSKGFGNGLSRVDSTPAPFGAVSAWPLSDKGEEQHSDARGREERGPARTTTHSAQQPCAQFVVT